MDGLENAVSLQEFIARVPISSLPRIIKITSGVYLQSSVYDISGTECCLSTGELVKIIDKQLQWVSCEDLCTGSIHVLHTNFPGHFQIFTDSCIYDTLEKLKRALLGDDYNHPFYFASLCDIVIGDYLIQQNHPIQCVPSELARKSSYATCYIHKGSDDICLKIPFSMQGQFYEYSIQKFYTLQEVLESPALLKRNLKCNSIGNGPYNISPMYEIKTIMQMRKDIVKIPSSLEVDVIDITSQCSDFNFIRPLSLTEASECKERFPVIAEILESSESSYMLKNDHYSLIRKGQKMVLYQTTVSKKVLASGTKGKFSRFFYIHDNYKGKFRQRPREFQTVYELWTKLIEGAQLNVVVTKDCESVEDCYPSLSVGDHLKVLYPTQNKGSARLDSEETNVIVCMKNSEDDEEESEEIMLPLYMEGRFVEEVVNSKKYALSDIIQMFKLPCEVKVVTKDPSLTTDPLASFSALRMEELIEEPVLLVSFLDNPYDCFEIPIKWQKVSLMFLEEPVPANKELTKSVCLEELPECFYYNLRKSLPRNDLPPPRPPKRQVKTEVELQHNVHSEKMKPKHMGLKPQSTVPPEVPARRYSVNELNNSLQGCTLQNKNKYTPITQKKITSKNVSDSDHDYEIVDPLLDKHKKKHEVIY